MNKDLLEIICCPESHQSLHLASSEQVHKLNELQSCGELYFECKDTVPYALTDALVTEDGKIIYPVREDIPVLLIEERILADSLPFSVDS
jgi:uncharacterized protein YbaR (Trm112 family)